MRLSVSQIAQVVLEQASRRAPHQVVAALGAVLARQGQLRQFPLIRAAIRARLVELGLVMIETGSPLAPAKQRQLADLLEQAGPRRFAHFTTNPQLGVGYRLFSGRGVVEASTATTLRNLAKHLKA